MSIVLGLDVSTSIVGISILDTSRLSVDRITLLSHCDFKKCNDLFDKADVVEQKLLELKSDYPLISHVVIEEPLMSFSPGMSSAKTISTLMKFNGMVSLIAKRQLHLPSYISASHARKVCGIKMLKFKVCGLSQKMQTFNYMQQNDLKHVKWPTKKSKKTPEPIVDWAYDECDAYVLASAFCIETLKTNRV